MGISDKFQGKRAISILTGILECETWPEVLC
jgi:hypothetical protein